MELSEFKGLVADGKFFSVKFIKRTDGRMRTMLCRTGVIPPPSPHAGERHWNPDDKGLLQVWDCHAKGYRMIPVENLREISAHGQRITL